MAYPRSFFALPRTLLLVLALVALSLFATFCEAKDYYGILGIPRDADDGAIKKAFRRLSLKYHPDKNPGDEEAHKHFVEVNEAHDVLSNVDKRHIYDIDGYEGLNKPQRGASPFDMMFGGGGGGHGGRPKGPNAAVDLPMSLEQLYNGAETSLQIERQVICSKCRGSGAQGGETKKCHACGGRGVVNKLQTLGPGFQVQMQQPCDACQGKGNVPKVACPICGGKRLVREKKSLLAVVERGMKDGHQIVFERESEQSINTTPGDVIATVRQQPHARFRREGNDLHTELSITLKDALLGFSRTVRQLDGREVTVGKTGVTSPFEVIRIEGEGMPVHGTPSIRGSMFVKVVVNLPPVLTQSQKDQLAKLF